MSLTITVLVDNLDSWILPYAQRLVDALQAKGHATRLIHRREDITRGDIAFLLSCEEIVPKQTLMLNRHNLVVHESALPEGKGWSPLTWQILEGKNEIPITLFEAAEAVDAGDIYYQDTLVFEGHELVDELRQAQGEKTIALCLRFVDAYPNVIGKPQQGGESFYPRRRPEDSELDPNKTIAEQFNNLRVADNERYPGFFHYQGQKYLLKIEKASDDPES